MNTFSLRLTARYGAACLLVLAGCAEEPSTSPFPEQASGGQLQPSGGTTAPITSGGTTASGGTPATVTGGTLAATGGIQGGTGGQATPPEGTGGLATGGVETVGEMDSGTPMTADKPVLPAVTTTETDGPFDTTIDMGRDYWVFRPAELGKEVLLHPVFVWGTGSTAVPSQYTDHFNQMASHGFVIVAPTPSQLNSGNMTAALNWILEENKRPGSDYFEKLDPDRVGMGGHSQGSTSTFDAEVTETRLKTTLHIAGGSFDGAGSSKVKTPTAYICGEDDIALNNCKRDFENVESQPTFFAELAGVDHVSCAREAVPAMIAWLRWHLAGETERAVQFTGPDGEYWQGMWGSETKNWNY